MKYYKFSHQKEATISMRLLAKLFKLKCNVWVGYHVDTELSRSLVTYLYKRN
jgi:hypothetical protein